jgi:TP901 family phage tail tape measure protein
MTLRTVGVRLTAEIAEYQSKLKAAGQSTRDFKGELDRAAQKGNLDKVTNAVGGLGLGLTGIAAGAVKLRADFDKAMSGVSAATHAPAGDLEQLRQAAIRAGKDTSYSATDAADAITELSKAGVKTTDVLNGGLNGALSLAAAGQLSVGEAAETAASALTQFKLQGSAVPHVADLLAAAAGKAQGSVHDIGYALNQSGLVASQFGLSIEDTTGALAEFANAGLIGSDAGTSFKTMLLAMANPSKQTKDAMNELGISFYDAGGKFVGISGVAQVLQTRLKGLTQEQRNAALAQIFGNDAIRAASVLFTDGAAGVQKWKAAVNDSGYAAATASALTNNLAGDLERLRGSLETIAIESGGGATKGLRTLAKGANETVNAFADLPSWVQESITVLSGVGGVSLLAAAGFLKARGTAKSLLDELRDMGPMGAKTAGGLGKIGSVAGRLGLVGVAAGGVYVGMKAFGDWVDSRSAPTVRDIDKMTEALQQFASTGKVTGELSKAFGVDLQGLTRDLSAIQKSQAELAKLQNIKLGPAGEQGYGRALAAIGPQIKQMSAQASSDIDALDQTLAKLATDGNVTAAKIAFDDFAHATGLSLDKLPKYAAAAKNASAANSGLAAGFGDAKANANTMTNSLDSAIQAGQTLTQVWDQLHGAVLSNDQAQLAAKQAIDGVKQSMKDNKKAIDGNSEAALKNRIAVGEAAQAAAKSAQAKYTESSSVEQASKTYNGYISQLRKTLIQSGLTKVQADRLIGSYGKMPSSISTHVSITGAGDVAKKLEGLSKIQLALAKGTKIPINPSTFFHGLAEGGWTGPGSKYQPAGIVHADEYVIKADSRRSIESTRPGLLDVMNRTGDVPEGYAGGGRVFPYPVNVSKTKIPDPMWSTPGGGIGGNVAQGGGPGYKWMEAAVRAAFPGMAIYSDYRPGAITLTGNRSYHSVGRAVDFAPSLPLAEWINLHFMRQTKELITPWQSLNIHNGQRHQYSALIENQHNFAGGNAHDHWAMANGGMITEPVFGIGASGRTYSFGENYQPERVTPMWQTGSSHGGGGGRPVEINVTFNGPVGSQQELQNWLTASIDNLKRRGRV